MMQNLDTPVDLAALSATIELAPVGIAQLDLEGRFLLVNERFCEILGYSRSDLLASTFQEVTFPEDLDHCVHMNTQLIRGEIPEYTEDKRFVRPDGSAVWTRVCVRPVFDEAGSIRFLLGTAQDISSEINANRARRSAEEQLHSALHASLVGAFRFNVRTHTLEWEDGLQRLFGPSLKPRTTLEELFGSIHPDDLARVSAAYARSVSDASDFDEEFRVIWEDGSVHWLHDRGQIVCDNTGRPLHITGACTDVTDSRRVQDELHRRDARFRVLANNIPQLTWISNRDGARSWFNDRWYEYTGRNFDQLRDFGWHLVIHPDDLERVRTAQHAAFRSDGVWQDTVSIRRHDGEYRQFLSHAVPVVDADGVVRQWFGTNTDITDQLETERILRELAEERQQLLRLEQGARTEAERASAMRDEVLAVVAHDLRNPVQTIIMSASSITDLSLSEANRDLQLDIIKRSAWRMDRLIKDLLDVSQIEAGTFKVAHERLTISRLIDEAIEQFDLLAKNAKITLDRDVAPGLPPIIGDSHRLAQVLSNLIGNALKFTQPGGHICLCAGLSGSEIHIAVRDTGCGIAPDHLEHVFRRFWQVDHKAGGVGLGLVIARGIVEAHQGELRVQSEQGRGTTFTVSLPIPH